VSSGSPKRPDSRLLEAKGPSSDSLVSFDAAQHLVSAAAGEPRSRRGLRDRLADLLDTITGPPAG